MTQPPTTPGPDEPASGPPLRPPVPDPAVTGSGAGFGGSYGPPPQLPPAGPPPVPPVLPPAGYPAGYDPAQSYAVYQQGAPTGGYGVPIFGAQDGYDPLVSPDYSGWWRRTMAVLRTAWRPLAALQLIGFAVTVLFTVPQAVYATDMMSRLPSAGDTTEVRPTFDLAPLLGILGFSIAGVFLTYLVKFAVSIASNHVAVAVACGIRPQVGAALAMAARRVFPLLGWQLLAGLIVLAGLCACVLPGIYLIAVFTILPAVVTFERGSAISRCFALFHRDLGSSVARIATILGISFAVGAVAAVVGQIIQIGSGGLNSFATGAQPLSSGMLVPLIVASALSALLQGAGAVLTAPLTLTAYADMRARVEAVSTPILAGEIGLAPAPAAEWTVPPVA